MRFEASFLWTWGSLPLAFLTLLACEQEKPAASSPEVLAKRVSQSAAQVEPSLTAEQPAQAPEGPPPWADRKVAGSGFPCAIEDVLSTSCRRCHWDPQENDAPFPLKSWEDTQAQRSGKPIFVLMKQMVAADLMPPLDALVSPKVESLSSEHKRAMLKWLEAGAKRADEVCK